MAEDEDGVPNKKSTQNLDNGGSSQENEQNRTDLPYFPRLLTSETEEAKSNNSENGDASPAEAKSTSPKSIGATRKEENPFSFRHFLKRDLSLPGNSTYENTGARPKVYANTVQHSPAEPAPAPAPAPASRADIQAKENSTDASNHRASDNTSSSSSVEASFSVVDDTESKHNLYIDNSDGQLYRPNLEPLGMPSLPDFVQDHILVEQAYLNSNGPISVDLDNLPDFTFNTSFNAGSSSSLGRRNNSSYSGGTRGYDYESYMGAASSSGESGQGRVPLDLPPGAEVAPGPDLSAHLSLDLTESVNPADRRNLSPRSTFPLDLPPNAGAESMRLPDFLPVHPGRTSPEPEHEDVQLQQIMSELERTRAELFAERARRSRLEAELGARADGACRTPADTDSTVAQLKNQIKRLKEELAASQEEARVLRGSQTRAARDLRHASASAETSLRYTDPSSRQEELAASQEEARVLRGSQTRAARDLRHASASAETSLRYTDPSSRQEELAASQEEARVLRGSQTRAARDLRHASASAETSLRYTDPSSRQEELAASQEEARVLRGSQTRAARDLRHASASAETSLRELLAGVERLKSLGLSLEPT